MQLKREKLQEKKMKNMLRMVYEPKKMQPMEDSNLKYTQTHTKHLPTANIQLAA